MKYANDERTYFLARFAYCGDKFFGVQEQPGRPTVLGALRARIEEGAQAKAHALLVAARTDRDVHALKNYASFYLKMPFDGEALLKSLAIPRDDGLYAVTAQKTPARCHARGDTGIKTYRYTIKDGLAFPCETSATAWEIVPKLSIAAMRFASMDFVGVKDFSSVRGGGCEAGSAVKHVLSVDIWRSVSGYVFIDFRGHGFLRRMVRNMVGLLVEIGAGIKPCDAVAPILAHKARTAAGIMAPAQGLCLMDIECMHEGF